MSAQTVQKNTVVTIRYRLDDAMGNPLQAKADEAAYLHGNYDNLLPKIEAALEGHEAGFATTVDLPPQDGFGVRDENLVTSMPRAELPAGTKVGNQVERMSPDGHARAYRVAKIKGQEVVLDGNHPFASKHVRFVVRILGIREATSDEVQHGHAHGEHGYSHGH